MTVDPIAWFAFVLGAVAFAYTLLRDIADGKRIDELSEALDLAAQELDRAVVRISYLEDAAHIQPTEPATRPQPIVRPVPTDTVEREAVIDAGLRKLSGATASGRHRAPR